MKNKFFILIFCLFVSFNFMGCHSHDFEPYNAQKEKTTTFIKDFTNAFGNNIETNHQWGTNFIPMVEKSVGSTRAAQTNGNQWGTDDDNGKYKDWPHPDPITTDELTKVLAVFNQKGAETYEPIVHWENYFVQHVYTGPNGSKMNELASVTDMTVKNWWPLEYQHTGTYTDDIINNFNAGTCTAYDGCMLMWFSSTEDFSFKTSQSGGQRIYGHWRMETIDGNVYVGFDHEAWRQAPANANEEDKRDYIYNDWIIKLIPGNGSTDVERVRIMCEDLGQDHSDFDYNDIVFDIKFVKEGSDLYADIIVQAAGGILPLTIGNNEVHRLFGQSADEKGRYPMINTGPGADINGLEPQPLYFRVGTVSQFSNAWEAINALPIAVQLENQQVITLTINPGAPAEMIAVPNTVQWSNERVSIKNRYPQFVDWISDSSIVWYE